MSHEKSEFYPKQKQPDTAVVSAYGTTSIEQKLNDIHADVHGLKQMLANMENKMSQEMDNLQAAVTKTRGVVDSAVALIKGLRQAIIDAGTDPAKLKALTDELNTDTSDLAAAVAAPGGSTGGATT